MAKVLGWLGSHNDVARRDVGMIVGIMLPATCIKDVNTLCAGENASDLRWSSVDAVVGLGDPLAGHLSLA